MQHIWHQGLRAKKTPISAECFSTSPRQCKLSCFHHHILYTGKPVNPKALQWPTPLAKQILKQEGQAHLEGSKHFCGGWPKLWNELPLKKRIISNLPHHLLQLQGTFQEPAVNLTLKRNPHVYLKQTNRKGKLRKKKSYKKKENRTDYATGDLKKIKHPRCQPLLNGC